MESSNDQDVVIDLPGILGWIWQRRMMLIAAGFAGAVLAVGISFVLTERFTATTTLVPQVPVERSGLIGRLASLTSFGSDLEGTNEILYGRILQSDRLLDKALERQWSIVGGSDSLSLYDVLGIERTVGQVDAEARERARRRLREKAVVFNRDPVSGFMKVRVTLPRNPDLAASLANYLVAELDRYNRTTRSQKAREHREFIEASLEQVADDLAAAENMLTQFLLNNKSYADSPRLLQQYNELDREFQAQRSIWVELKTQLETAKVDEHKETPSLYVLDAAESPLRRSFPDRLLFAFVGALLGVLLWLAIKESRNQFLGNQTR
jgi:uncharacterized protein involved in exopolysaccharide biosynthesis